VLDGFVMTLRDFAHAAVAAVVLVLAFVAPTAAQPVDLWTVSNIPVDATGNSPSAAKEAALAQGRQKAWTEVFRRITPSSEWARQPQLTPAELEPMVKSFDISGEKHSSTRYLATVTYVFNPTQVRAALRRTGTQFSESTAKPVLVVPLNGTAWSPESPWGRAWAAGAARPPRSGRGAGGRRAGYGIARDDFVGGGLGHRPSAGRALWREFRFGRDGGQERRGAAGDGDAHQT
jgi:hypothetical protein